MHYRNYSYCYAEYKAAIEEIYNKSFPKSERFPFWVLWACNYNNSGSKLDAIIDHELDKVVGMRFIVDYKDIRYLMYLAIDEKYRNKGFGSDALKDIILSRADCDVLLCIERPSTDLNDIKLRRKEFYLRNGFYSTGIFIEDSGVEYEFLSSSKERVITEENLKMRYSCMTRNSLVMHIVKKTFDADIKFVN